MLNIYKFIFTLLYSGIKKKNHHNIKFHQVFRRKMYAILTKVLPEQLLKNMEPSYSHNTIYAYKNHYFPIFS